MRANWIKALAHGLLLPAAALAQGDPGDRRLGPVPGASGAVGPEVGDQGEPLFGGRAGPASPRVPSSITRPGGFGIPDPLPFVPEPEIPGAELPVFGPLELPTDADEGPPGGLTLDGALARLVGANLDLQALRMEIPKAQADVITAGLIDNPILFFDTQFIPYQRFTEERPGGPTQYDLNVTLPIDLNGKRWLRADVASRVRRIVEAQYQDAVRLRVGDLYEAFVGALAARETVRFAEASVLGLEGNLERTRALLAAGEITPGEVRRIEIQLETARIGLVEAHESYADAKRVLAPLLNIRPQEAESLELRGSLHDRSSPLPPPEELVRLALGVRPDLVAYRIGLGRAQADVRLAHAERFQDVYLLVQPYTFQDLSPFGARSAHSGALGITVPLPITNRNQGNIRRAIINVGQTRTELASLEQQIAVEVLRAERRYSTTRTTVRRIESQLLPSARQVRDEARRRWAGGEASLGEFLEAQREYNDLVRQYRDTLVRHRMSMLELNTAVGHRIMP